MNLGNNMLEGILDIGQIRINSQQLQYNAAMIPPK